MTNEKAGMIKRTIELLERDCSNMNFQCDCERKCNTDGRDCYIKFAIKVIKKQIPLKPKLIHKIDRSGMHYNDVVCECGCSFHYIGRVNYCPMCGQALEWWED